MTTRKNLIIMAGFVLSVSLLSVSAATMLLTDYYSCLQMHIIDGLCTEIIDKEPLARDAVLSALKEEQYCAPLPPSKSLFSAYGYAYGYKQTDFLRIAVKNNRYPAASGFLIGAALFLLTLFLLHKRESARIKRLTEYLEKAGSGGDGVLFPTGEDDFSKLQDEICKTVTELRQTKEAAVKAKNDFAENLYNIAHQLKTPITAISLSVQRIRGKTAAMPERSCVRHLNQIGGQLARLTRLEEALLLLSRIDSGTLSFYRKEIDLYTLLMLSADNLQELSAEAEVHLAIPETGEILIYADLDWTMEAFINLFKNCIEHTPGGGCVCCAFEQNPLYTQIRIWDNGSGFEKEDLPRLFERFYRGKNAAEGGIGIGLAISKAIIERQNGTITARNLPEGGALFEIRFYSH